MNPITISEAYMLKNGEKCIVVGAYCEIDAHAKNQWHKPIIVYEIMKEDGEIHLAYESDIESEVMG